jgi:hypothetical protein
VEAEEVAQAAKAAADSEEAATGGALTAAIKEILKEHHISVQRYRNAAHVGPGVWRFLAAYVAILEALAAKIFASKGASAAAEFTATQSCVQTTSRGGSPDADDVLAIGPSVEPA